MFAELTWRNPNLSEHLYVIGLANMVLAGVTVWVRWLAARHGLLSHRVHAFVLTLAAVYAAGYGWLLFSDVDPGTWSNWIRPIALLAWPVVWIMPALADVQTARRVHRKAAPIIRRHEGDD